MYNEAVDVGNGCWQTHRCTVRNKKHTPIFIDLKACLREEEREHGSRKHLCRGGIKLENSLITGALRGRTRTASRLGSVGIS